MKIYKNLYQQILEEVRKRGAGEMGGEITMRGVIESLISPSASNQAIAAIYQYLNHALKEQIVSGIYVEADSPSSRYVWIRNKGEEGYAMKKGVLFNLAEDVKVEISLPQPNAPVVLFLNLTVDGRVLAETAEYDDRIAIAKINIPYPQSLDIVNDYERGSMSAYIVTARDLCFKNDFPIDDNTINALRNNMSKLLADNLVGNIKLSEGLKILNQRGTLRMDSEKIEILYPSGVVGAKFDKTGTYFHSEDGKERARFTADDARIGNIRITGHALESVNYETEGFQIKDTGEIQLKDQYNYRMLLKPDGIYLRGKMFGINHLPSGDDYIRNVVLKKSITYWDSEYEANELPHNATPAWTEFGGSEEYHLHEIIDGQLKVYCQNVAGGNVGWYRTESEMSNSVGATLEARVKLTKVSTEGVNPVNLYILDGTKGARLIIRKGSIEINSVPETIYYMNTMEYHNYRLTLKGQEAKVYVDGELKFTTAPDMEGPEKSIKFWITKDNGESEAYFDWIYYRIDGAFSPETGPDIPGNYYNYGAKNGQFIKKAFYSDNTETFPDHVYVIYTTNEGIFENEEHTFIMQDSVAAIITTDSQLDASYVRNLIVGKIMNPAGNTYFDLLKGKLNIESYDLDENHKFVVGDPTAGHGLTFDKSTGKLSVRGSFEAGGSKIWDSQGDFNGYDKYQVDIDTIPGKILLERELAEWIQTTKADFEAGILTHINTWDDPGSFKMAVTPESLYCGSNISDSYYYSFNGAMGQSFKTFINCYCTRARIWIARAGSPPNFYVHLKRDTNGAPGTTITSKYVTSSEVPTTPGWFYLDWADAQLEGYDPYWIYIPQFGDANNYIRWYYSTANPYPNGNAWYDAGNRPSSDFRFGVYEVHYYLASEGSADLISQNYHFGVISSWEPMVITKTLNGQTVIIKTQTAPNNGGVPGTWEEEKSLDAQNKPTSTIYSDTWFRWRTYLISDTYPGWYTPVVYDITAKAKSIYYSNGHDRIKYSFGSKVSYTTYSFVASEPTNTNAKVRFRCADTETGLASASWSAYFDASSGDMEDANIFDSIWIEVEVYLETTDDEVTPEFDKLTVNFMAGLDADKLDTYHLADIALGWFPAEETWTYASADDPTFTFTISGDKTGKYSPGMRIKLTQTTVKYFIITAVSYSSPNTTVIIYGGTDYDLANATITDPYYSPYKAPFGFPLNPDKWTVEVTDTTNRSQASPTIGTWYNLGSINIQIPIGIWNVEYFVLARTTRAASTTVDVYTTLSTGNNNESDADFTGRNYLKGASGTIAIILSIIRKKILSLSAKTTYYLNTKTGYDADSIDNWNNSQKLFIRAICAYL